MATGLAYVGKINSLSPIEQADRIELAEVVCGEGGKWLGVVGKGQFKVGDRCHTFVQDAVVPPRDDMAFLEKTNWRVKMQRFRGVPSECVVMPQPLLGDWGIYDVGQDLTEALGVTKYTKEEPQNPTTAGDPACKFPSFVPKTDEPNFQTAGRLVQALRGQAWYATVKADGMSSTCYRWGERFGVCSRNLQLYEYVNNVHWSLALKHGLKEKLPDGMAIQWETVGPGIQKNPIGLKEVTGLAFQAWNIKEGRYLDYPEFCSFCHDLGFPTVAVAGGGDAFDMTDDQLRKFAEGQYQNGKHREGVVIRPVKEQWVGPARLSVKVINLLYKD
jgi:RNA ligase (TIGR02306 family)